MLIRAVSVVRVVREKTSALRSSMRVAILAMSLAACESASRGQTLFELKRPAETGVTFANRLAEDTTFNILNYLYYYNGGGVAAGDVNNDGLPDLYFTSNLESDKLYLNRGNFRFEDVTDRAGVGKQPGWTSGVTMADVNGDGHLDIYVSTVSYLALTGRNVLYLNNGDGTFTDRTKEFGLEHEGFGTQAAFFDYDNDGDLDVYLLNSSAHTERGPSRTPQRAPRHPKAGDRFLRNDGGRFTDVSDAAGIYGGVEGYGLGVVASDLNGDGCMDVYVANDFQENDFVYYNDCKGGGRFTESVAKAMPHTSQFAMGVDAADFNNDGRPDVAVLDMLPERDEILKTSAAAERLELHQLKMQVGYHPQYARNTLQLNRGGGRFSDIGYLAGVSATDWSWAPLFADFDNDGRKDLFITNGIYRRPNDLDYIAYVGSPVAQAMLARGVGKSALELLKHMPHVPIPNYAYHNNGDLTFTNRAESWGLAQPGFSNGAAYADLDNDGALDLVVNNINAPASIYRNRAREQNGRHYLQVQLRGSGRNTAGVGARVLLYTGRTTQALELMPTRGFQSSVDPRLHFGLDTVTRIDSLRVTWPDRTSQLLTNVEIDRTIEVAQSAAHSPQPTAHSPKPLFTDVSSATGIDFKHVENQFNDFAVQPLMPHMLSMEGPALAVGDVNGDSLDDLYIGGARRQAGKLYVQQRGGGFVAHSLQGPPPAHRVDSATYEDIDAAFFDADGDGDLDLYAVSGGNEVWTPSPPQRDRLYFNDGRGNFTQRPDALPRLLFHQGSCVTAADFDGDGDVDLFVGSRVQARMYGWTPSSWLLLNDGEGHFTVSRGNMSMGVGNAGMVTDCEWADVSGDGRLDLVVVGEWMRIHTFRYEGGRLIDRTRESGLDSTNGWWNSVTAADLDNDGDTDLVLGNLGLNSAIRGSATQPARLYVADVDGNGTPEQILTIYRNAHSRLFAGRDEILGAIHSPDLRDHFRTYASFADADVEDIVYPPPRMKDALVLEAYQFASSVAINDGTGRFIVRPLPVEAQFAPVYASVVQDFDGDGRADILLGGNFYGVTPTFGRYDASYGLVLRGTGGGNFVALDPEESGVLIEGQVRDMKVLRGARGESLIAVARNNDALQFLRVRSGSSAKSP